MYNSSKNKLSTIYLFEEQDTSEGAEWFHIDGQGGYFWKIEFDKLDFFV